jgi:cell division protein FtsI/penicillin-binding protein 2/cell division protein FtsW (lipid II flippase)
LLKEAGAVLTLECGGPAPAIPKRRGRDLPGDLFDVLALVAVLVLAVLGALNLYAVAGWSRATHQLAVVAAGLVLLAAMGRVRVERLALLGWACYGLSVLLLVATLVVGREAHGARRWLDLGVFTVQPSELAKLGLLLVLAHVLGSDRPSWQRLVLAIGLAMVPVGLTVVEPDLSTATILTALTVALLILGRIPWRLLLPLVTSAALLPPLAIPLLRSYQLERLQAFLSHSYSPDGPGYALMQAHISLAWGGLTGRSREPLHDLLAEYLPGRQTDFAFASLVEQWGLISGVAAVVAALIVLWRVALASRVARTRHTSLVGAGLAALFGVQVVVSVGGNVGGMPIAGIPFPFLSYGGTAAAIYLAALGLVLGGRRDGVRRRLWAPPRWRNPRPRCLRGTALGLTGVLVAFATYGWHVQVAQGASLRRAGKVQMTRCIRIHAPRGIITDRHGNPLAVNAAHDEVVAVPALLLRNPDAVARLADLIAQPVSQLHQALASDELSVRVATTPAGAGARIAAAGLPGVLVIPSPWRVYPYGALLGPLLGFVGVATPHEHRRWPGLPLGEIVGRAGIEQQYDAILRGVAGEQCVYVDPPGRPVAIGLRRDPVPGASLRLSIDLGLQERLTAALAEALRTSRGDLGGAVAMDPRTGQILAMASLPGYDNNLYGPPVDVGALRQARTARGHLMLEHVTQVVAPPGSAFKVVVAATDMVYPVFSPDKAIPTGGSFTYGGHTFGNWRSFGPQNLVQAIAWSNDVYFYKLALALGPDRIHEVGTALGIGRPTGIDLPGESSGYLGTPQSVSKIGARWYPGSTVILGIGQGYVTTTPLQAARWTAALATGRLVTPRLGLAFDAGDGMPIALPTPEPAPLPFAAALERVREGMRQAVLGGTAGKLRGLPASALAKTGTAQDPASPTGADDAWFTAAAPADDPVVAVVSFVRGGGWGSRTSGPVVRETLQYFFDHQADILTTLSAPQPR